MHNRVIRRDSESNLPSAAGSVKAKFEHPLDAGPTVVNSNITMTRTTVDVSPTNTNLSQVLSALDGENTDIELVNVAPKAQAQRPLSHPRQRVRLPSLPPPVPTSQDPFEARDAGSHPAKLPAQPKKRIAHESTRQRFAQSSLSPSHEVPAPAVEQNSIQAALEKLSRPARETQSALIGNYRVVSTIASGSMGVVVRAEHVHLGRPVAIKLLHKHYCNDTDIAQRFMAEAIALSTVSHPAVVTIFDYGFTENMIPYFVMELLEGETLAKKMQREHDITPSHAIDITRQIALALGAVHRHNFVHRDLKPENIFLIPNPTFESGMQVKLVDFGIAKMSPPQWVLKDRFKQTKTQHDKLLGTPYYMAPEQTWDPSTVDSRCDIYALGCVTFEMLSGEPPFSGGVAEALLAHRHKKTPSIRALRPNLSPILEFVLLRMMQKRPQDRFQTMEAVAQALDQTEEVVGTEPLLAEPAAPVRSKSEPTGVVSDWLRSLREKLF